MVKSFRYWAVRAERDRRRRLPAAFYFTDRRRADSERVVSDLPAGTGVIVRDYDARDRAALAARMVALCRRRRLTVLIAGDWRLAASLAADGVHLPESALFAGPPPRHAGWLMTAAAHSIRALDRAARIGADGAFVSPAFETDSHPGTTALGPHRLSRLASHARLPVYALGGIDDRTVRRLPSVHLAGIGGIGLFGTSARGGMRARS